MDVTTGLYDKAHLAFQTGLKHDPNSEELKDGARRALDAFTKRPMSDELSKLVARAVADPELGAIMTDPVVQQLFCECSSDLAALATRLKNAGLAAAKVQKLVDYGIITF